MKIIFIFFYIPIFTSFLYGQGTDFTLACYNSLRYSPNNIDARHPDLRLIINDLQPDILCVEELSGLPSAQMYLDSVLNVDSTTYSMATFIDGNDLDISLYYKTQKFTFLQTITYPTALRDIYHFQLTPIESIDTLHVFGVHLKASTGSSNELARKGEVDVLRSVTDQLPTGSRCVVCGDVNIYKSSEPAYGRLLEDTPGNDGHFVDHFTLPGTWNNAAYAIYHTQSPRTTQFNGGASGGMDDRFDLILMSEALDDTTGLHYVPGTMYAYGNDGLHYNKSINELPVNTAVGQTIADALYYASDHIPVVAQFSYTPSHVAHTEFALEDVYISMVPGGILVSNPVNRTLQVDIFSIDGRRYLSKILSSSTTLILPRGLCIVRVHDRQGHGYLSQLLSVY